MRKCSLMTTTLLLLAMTLAGCGSPQPKDPAPDESAATVACLKAMLGQDNFAADWTHGYPGCPDPLVHWYLNVKMDAVIGAFITAAEDGATPPQYLTVLQAGLKMFDGSDYDSEECDQIYWNFGRIMDCVGLESSEGALNRWRYGFDPTPLLRDPPQ